MLYRLRCTERRALARSHQPEIELARRSASDEPLSIGRRSETAHLLGDDALAERLLLVPQIRHEQRLVGHRGDEGVLPEQRVCVARERHGRRGGASARARGRGADRGILGDHGAAAEIPREHGVARIGAEGQGHFFHWMLVRRRC